MARPESNTVSYFPFYCEEGKKMHYLEETYGNDGFATFVKLLRELAKTDNHYLDLSKKTTVMFLAAKCKVTVITLELIINDLVELGKFDKVLWDENKIIWCEDFINSIQDAYLKRKSNCMTYDGLLSLLVSFGVRKQSKLPTKAVINTQIKEEEIKEEKKKYGTRVAMLEKEFDKLVSEHGIDKTNWMIAVLDNYKVSKGKTYKEDYRAILSWVVGKAEKEYITKSENTSTRRKSSEPVNPYDQFR